MSTGKHEKILHPSGGTPQLPFEKALAERIHLIRRKLGWSQRELAENLGRATNNAVSRLERGTAGSVLLDLLEQLILMAEEAGYTAEWLFRGNIVSDLLKPEALQEALNQAKAWEVVREQKRAKQKANRALNAGSNGFLKIVGEDLPDDPMWFKRYVPIVGSAAAGEGIETSYAEATPPGWAEAFVRVNDAPKGAFAVEIRGGSMLPEFMDGDLVIVDPSVRGRSGDICVVLYQCPKTHFRLARLKKLIIKGEAAILESLNPDFQTITLDAKSLFAAYRVYKHLPRIVFSKI